MKYQGISKTITVFRDRRAPEKGTLIGYGALIAFFDLRVPLPDVLSIVSEKHKKYYTESWMVFTPRYLPKDDLLGHLTFALKYEGIELGTLKKLFEKLARNDVTQIVSKEPNGQYSRKLWFLFEWLMEDQLDLPDLKQGNNIDLVDANIQYTLHTGYIVSNRHRIRNNLPGVQAFCPMVRKTKKLEEYIKLEMSGQLFSIQDSIAPNLVAKLKSTLSHQESSASYLLSGKTTPIFRIQNWSRAIKDAGKIALSNEGLLWLYSCLTEDSPLSNKRFRDQEVFIGRHDRQDGFPIPAFIPAKHNDLHELLGGLIKTEEKLENDGSFDPVLAATMISFGIEFIQPFFTGNGRIQRYVFQHVLHRKGFAPVGFVIPLSQILLKKLDNYMIALEQFSVPRLEYIAWEPSSDHNIKILNVTHDLYRYFDATMLAEFFYESITDIFTNLIPEEVAYQQNYESMKTFLDDRFPMPDSTAAALIRNLIQGNGYFSENSITTEFKTLSDNDIREIERKFDELFKPINPLG